MRVTRRALLLAMVVGLLPGTVSAQAWLKPTGGYYAKLSASYFSSDSEFNFLGDEQDIFAEDATRTDTRYRDMSFALYSEYGALNWVTIVSSVSYKIVRTWEQLQPFPQVDSEEAIRTNYGLADLWIGGRIPLVRYPVAASIQSGVKIPLGYDRQPENEGPPLGTGEVDGDVSLNVGYSFWPRRSFVQSGVGYRARGGAFSDEFFFYAEAGYTARLFLKGRIDGLQTTETPPDLAGFTVVTPIPGGVLNQVIVGDQNVYRLNLEASYLVAGKFSAYAELFHIFAGKNTVAGPSISAGVVIQNTP